MINQTQKKNLTVDVGKTVRVTIPDVDRSKGDSRNILAVVLSSENGLYKLGCRTGILNGHQISFWNVRKTSFLFRKYPQVVHQYVQHQIRCQLLEGRVLPNVTVNYVIAVARKQVINNLIPNF